MASRLCLALPELPKVLEPHTGRGAMLPHNSIDGESSTHVDSLYTCDSGSGIDILLGRLVLLLRWLGPPPFQQSGGGFFMEWGVMMAWSPEDFASVYSEMVRSRGLVACVWVNKRCILALAHGGRA